MQRARGEDNLTADFNKQIMLPWNLHIDQTNEHTQYTYTPNYSRSQAHSQYYTFQYILSMSYYNIIFFAATSRYAPTF